MDDVAMNFLLSRFNIWAFLAQNKITTSQKFIDSEHTLVLLPPDARKLCLKFPKFLF
jgi:hypothetical protein